MKNAVGLRRNMRYLDQTQRTNAHSFSAKDERDTLARSEFGNSIKRVANIPEVFAGGIFNTRDVSEKKNDAQTN